jgi:cell division septation protein DedD
MDDNLLQKETSYKSFFLWGCVFFFSATVMFTLGVFVGRGTAPITFDIDKLERQLGVVQEVQELENAIYSNSDKQAILIPEFEFYKELKSNEEEIPIKIIEKKSLKISSKKEIARQLELELNPSFEKSAKPAKPIKPIKQEKQRIAKQQQNQRKLEKQTVNVAVQKNLQEAVSIADIRKNIKQETDNDDIKKISVKSDTVRSEKSNNKEKYTIQVAALNNFSDAFNLVNTLKNRGYLSYMIIKKHGKITWYRIRVGSFNTKAEALKVETKLKAGKYKTIVLIK